MAASDQDESDSLESTSASTVITASPTEKTAVASHDPYRALRFRDFRLLFTGSLIATLGTKMLEVAIGWQLYERTGSALVLGIVGLVLVIPVLLLSLLAGQIADRFNRKQVIMAAEGLIVAASFGLVLLSLEHGPLVLIYGCLLLLGTGSAFSQPARSALISQTVPESVFENAATWNSSSWQLASVLGPTLSGLLIALFQDATLVYLLNTLAALCFVVLLVWRRGSQQTRLQKPSRGRSTLQSLVEGVSFLRRTQIILAAITLDMFAVLLGGATTLLPIYAKDILHVGPIGLGWLNAAPSIGAIGMALLLAHRRPFQKAGRTLLLAVIGFGLATVIFGLSHNFWLSLLMLFLLGGLDNISVVIRGTLLLVRTPDQMRGRVAAVNALFIGISNEMGGFESGVTAQLFGPVASVVGGGIGTILVVLLVALIWPEMRRLSTLREQQGQGRPA